MKTDMQEKPVWGEESVKKFVEETKKEKPDAIAWRSFFAYWPMSSYSREILSSAPSRSAGT